MLQCLTMDLDKIRQRLDEERRSLPNGADALDVRPLVTRAASQVWKQHWIIYSKLDETNAGAAIDEEVAHHRAIGQQFEWKLYAHDTPSDLMQRLRSHGFEI